MKKHTARIIFAASDENSDLYYLTRFLTPDSYAWFEKNGRSAILLNDLERDRGRREARADRVVPLEAVRAARRKASSKPPRYIDLVAFALKQRRIRNVEVPSTFPVGFADDLRKLGIRVEPVRGPFVRERLWKTSEEVRVIVAAIRKTEKVLAGAIRLIARSKIRGRFLYEGKKKLTAERVKAFIAEWLLREAMLAEGTIVACGEDACEPHNRGAGPLRAHTAIILDVFPRSAETRYFADITRTVVRGKASPELMRIYTAVAGAQKAAFRMIRTGRTGAEAHKAVCGVFERLGYKTGEKNGKKQGFIHGTGHGLGLDIHELPVLSTAAARPLAGFDGAFRGGEVVTVEPGLYYPGVGAVRLEDDVLVTRTGCRILTRFPKVLELG
jgi:Xaa-Pro aminopeptidase